MANMRLIINVINRCCNVKWLHTDSYRIFSTISYEGETQQDVNIILLAIS
jgi:hypothetical protein